VATNMARPIRRAKVRLIEIPSLCDSGANVRVNPFVDVINSIHFLLPAASAAQLLSVPRPMSRHTVTER
jgi:hypothetical protein